ncbi:uncharacterized protein LOC121368290 [Gigantopelta aegis]|uniref:uncharacterized protein LOC121368290 n=1 Tax=Gigantopelta aegis TaxID=1735272 RepID=UPI001B88E001|nr:uncharacterized protein LOC121368290 [Gigantopelta aegis]XP_041348892.1 uncharacterized protein LOC121368290 [Gigantopelta aegis]
MAQVKVTRWDAAKDGPVDEEKMKKKLAALGFEVKRYEFPAGKTFDEHSHGEYKVDAITSGQFECTHGGTSVVLKPGDYLEMPPNVAHSAKIVGSETVVLFDGTKK